MDYIYMESESSSDEYVPDIEISSDQYDSDDPEYVPVIGIAPGHYDRVNDADEESDEDDENDHNSPMATDVPESIDVTEVYNVAAVAAEALPPAAEPPPAGETSKAEATENDPPAKCSQRKSIADASVDDDGQTCTICFEPWTNTSEHRLISLRCGHLFGRSCITRWLKGQNARCPQCNARARKSEIRNIYAKTVKAMDSTERDRALLDLQKESERRRKTEMELSQEKLRYIMKAKECELLKSQLMEAHDLLQEYRSNKKYEIKAASKPPSFHLEKCIELNSKDGKCRIMDASDMLSMILVSQQSPIPMFSGYGFRKISTSDLKPSEFVLVHQNIIKDLSFHPRDALALTASLDKCVKITNVLTNAVVQTYTHNSVVWSCTWDKDNPLYFYAGTNTSDVFLYDIRVTSRHVLELPRFGCRTPVLALQYISQSNNPSLNMSGPLVGKFQDCAFFQKSSDGGEHKPHPFHTLGTLASLSTMQSNGHFLISYRPSHSQPRLTHTLCELVTSPGEEGVQCNPIQVVSGGRSQIQLSRAKLQQHPTDPTSLLICAGDEDAHGALIWDGSSGKQIDHLKSDSSIFDFAEVKVNHQSVLVSLTDNSLRLYKWSNL